jgi:hypothetical protein
VTGSFSATPIPAGEAITGPSWLKSKAGYYYYGVFGARMPDWSLRDPAVIAWRHLHFWLNRFVQA